MFPVIQSPTPNLELSQAFYKKLAFSISNGENGFFACSKNLIIEVNKDRTARAGLKLYGNNWQEILEANNLKNSATKTATGFLVTSPSGCCLYLEESNSNAPENKPPNKTSVLGNFAGLSLETNIIETSIEFWAKFGFKQTAGNIEHGWVSLTNEVGFSIGLMKYGACPHLFFNPSLSFFNGTENPGIIAKIRSLEIDITEEITVFNNDNLVDNILVRDPGGLGCFIFND